MKNERARERGLTLIELVVSAGLLVFILHSTVRTFLVTADAQHELLTRDVLEEKTRKAAEALTNRLRAAKFETVSGVPESPATSPIIRFKRQVGFNATKGFVWGPEETIELVGGAIEARTATQRWVIGRHISSVAFSLQGRNLLIDLFARGQGRRGEAIRVVRRTHVTLRN